MHDLLVAIVAVVVVGGASTGAVLTRRSRRARPPGAPPLREPRPDDGDARTGTLVEERPEVAPPPEDTTEPPAAIIVVEAPPDEVVVADVDDLAGEPDGAVDLLERPRLRDRLGKARSLFGGYLTTVRSRDRIDNVTWEDLEEALILADVGAELTAALLDDLRAKVRKESVTSPDELIDLLRTDLVGRLAGDRELHLVDGATNVWLFVGVNGVGKTTTIGKLGLRQRQEGRSVVMAAGDTFRAAAAEQLQRWGERVDAPTIRGNEGGDPGAVIFDAVQHAASRGTDLVLADTAGRLHNKVNLMEELKKVRRVAERPPGHVSEVLLVIDATTGQNGLTQARQFASAVGVTGVVLTKLDGTAKGGIVLAIQADLGIPIKLVGVGEKAEDLITFDPVEFVDALVGRDD